MFRTMLITALSLNTILQNLMYSYIAFLLSQISRDCPRDAVFLCDKIIVLRQCEKGGVVFTVMLVKVPIAYDS